MTGGVRGLVKKEYSKSGVPSAAQTSDDVVEQLIDQGGIGVQQLLVVSLCFLFNVLDGFDITAMAVVAGAVSSELELSPEGLGWIFSFALAGMMVGAMVLAPVSDIVGRRRTIVGSVLLVGSAVLLTARATTLTEFIVLRFAAGVGAGAMMACQAALADEYSPSRLRALFVGIVTSGYPTGAMLTSVVAGFVLPEHGWRGMFWLGGVGTLAMVVLAWCWIPESLKFLLSRRPPEALPKANAILARMGRNDLPALPTVQPSERRGAFLANLKTLVAPEFRAMTLQVWTTFFLSFTSLYFLMSWVPKIVEDAGYTAADGRRAFFLMNLGAIVGIYALGVLATRRSLSNLIAAFFGASAVAMFVCAAMATELALLLVLVFLIGFAQQGGFTAMYSAAARIYPTDIRSTGIGWAIGLGRFGAVVGPAFAGYLIAAGVSMSGSFVVFAIPMAIASLLAFRLHVD